MTTLISICIASPTQFSRSQSRVDAHAPADTGTPAHARICASSIGGTRTNCWLSKQYTDGVRTLVCPAARTHAGTHAHACKRIYKAHTCDSERSRQAGKSMLRHARHPRPNAYIIAFAVSGSPTPGPVFGMRECGFCLYYDAVAYIYYSLDVCVDTFKLRVFDANVTGRKSMCGWGWGWGFGETVA